MSKDKISDYSATANSNTDIAGINIDEGCAPSGINNAIRTLMKQLKDWQSGSQDVYITPAGSAAAPAVTTTGDTNTGILFPAADTVAVSTGGTERVRVDSAGNVGVGVTPAVWWSPVKVLQVGSTGSLWNYNSGTKFANNYYANSSGGDTYLTTNYATMYEQIAGKHIWYNAPSGTAGNPITFTQAMTLDASGNLGIGTTSPAQKLHISGGTSTALQISATGNASSGLKMGYAGSSVDTYISNTENGVLILGTNNTERARIDSSGNLLVGTTNANPNAGAGVKMGSDGTDGSVAVVGATSTNSNVTYRLYSTGAGAYRFYVGYGGTINATSTTITGISDQRLKENIRDLDDGLEKVLALQPRKFDWKEGKGADIKNARGFIAQEFETVFPDMIEEWLDEAPEGEEPYKAVNANLIPTLVKAIQEQQAIIQTLTQRIEALEQA